jgi:hypothetical protein
MEPEMRVRYIVVLLAFSLAGCLQAPTRTPKAGANFVNNDGTWVEIGTDGKAHPTAPQLDQVPIGMSPSSLR